MSDCTSLITTLPASSRLASASACLVFLLNTYEDNPKGKLLATLAQRIAIGSAMRKLTPTLAAMLLICGTALADSYRVHYSIKGSGRDITVQAESSAEARRTVMEMFPGAVVSY